MPETPHQEPDRDEYRDDLDETVRGPERRALLNLAVKLAKARPIPRAGMRSEIRSSLLTGRRAAREARETPPQRVRSLIAGYAFSGVLLLGIAAAGLAGAGPFAA